MPLLQILYESLQRPFLNKGGTNSKTSTELLGFLSFFEVLFRFYVRITLFPHIFNFVLILGVFAFVNSHLNLLSRRLFQGYYFGDPQKIQSHAGEGSSTLFSPPSSFVDAITKTWIITDYCYDRFVLHAPLCVYYLWWGYPVEKYKYRPRGVFSKWYKDELGPSHKDVKGNAEDIDYVTSLKSFRLTTGTSSPIKLISTLDNLPLTPQDFLVESAGNVQKANSPLSKRRQFKYLFAPSSAAGAVSNLKEHEDGEDGEEELNEGKQSMMQVQEFLNSQSTPNKGSIIRIKFNRRKSSGGPIRKLNKSRRSRYSDTESIDSSVKFLDDFDYNAVKLEIRKRMGAPQDFDDGSFGPLFVRLAWHTSATYDQSTRTGGSAGATMRFPPELTDGSNTGLHTALLEMELVKQKFPWISYGDLWTLAGVTSLEEMGCHPIRWIPGRIDCVDDSRVPPNGRLPLGYLGSEHIRKIFTTQLGFDDRETVLLIGGGHSLGRCHSKYSGWEGKWTENPIHFSNRFFTALLNEEWELAKVPVTGRDQFVSKKNDLMMLNTDMELAKDPVFRKWSEYYAEDNERFLKDFAEVFAKLIELGVPRS